MFVQQCWSSTQIEIILKEVKRRFCESISFLSLDEAVLSCLGPEVWILNYCKTARSLDSSITRWRSSWTNVDVWILEIFGPNKGQQWFRIVFWKMLTPVFELSQDDEFVVVIIKTPYVKVWIILWARTWKSGFCLQNISIVFSQLYYFSLSDALVCNWYTLYGVLYSLCRLPMSISALTTQNLNFMSSHTSWGNLL